MRNTGKMLLLITFLSLSWQAIAGWEITYRNSDMDGEITYDVLLIEDNTLKYSGIDGGFIYDSNSEEFIFLMPGANNMKGYWKGTLDEYRNSFDKAMNKALQEMINSFPEEQREMLKGMFDEMKDMYATPTPGDIDALKLRISKSGESLEVAGFDTDKYEVFINESLVETLWISYDIAIADDMDTRSIIEMFNEITPAAADDDILYQFSDDYLDLLEDGFIMKSSDSDLDDLEVIKIVERNISKADLAIPEDYIQMTADELIQSQMMGSDDEDDGDDW